MTTVTPTDYDAAHGLTSRQTWTQQHISRCALCGAWQCLTHFETLLRAAPGYVAPAFCVHLIPKAATTGAAA
jgi:hypothetical protein